MLKRCPPSLLIPTTIHIHIGSGVNQKKILITYILRVCKMCKNTKSIKMAQVNNIKLTIDHIEPRLYQKYFSYYNDDYIEEEEEDDDDDKKDNGDDNTDVIIIDDSSNDSGGGSGNIKQSPSTSTTTTVSKTTIKKTPTTIDTIITIDDSEEDEKNDHDHDHDHDDDDDNNNNEDLYVLDEKELTIGDQARFQRYQTKRNKHLKRYEKNRQKMKKQSSVGMERRRRQRKLNRLIKDMNRNSLRQLLLQSITTTTTTTTKSVEKTCDICYESTSLNLFAWLSCNHAFCMFCILRLKSTTCPYCRADIIPTSSNDKSRQPTLRQDPIHEQITYYRNIIEEISNSKVISATIQNNDIIGFVRNMFTSKADELIRDLPYRFGHIFTVINVHQTTGFEIVSRMRLETIVCGALYETTDAELHVRIENLLKELETTYYKALYVIPINNGRIVGYDNDDLTSTPLPPTTTTTIAARRRTRAPPAAAAATATLRRNNRTLPRILIDRRRPVTIVPPTRITITRTAATTTSEEAAEAAAAAQLPQPQITYTTINSADVNSRIINLFGMFPSFQ